MRKKVYKFHTLQTELKNIDPYAFCFGNTYMGVPPCTCPGSMQDHKIRTDLCQILWFESWISWFIPKKMLEISQFCIIQKYKNYFIIKNHFKSHAYLKFWLESTVSFLSWGRHVLSRASDLSMLAIAHSAELAWSLNGA